MVADAGPGPRGAQYVEECFSNSSLFHKALKEAFESFCNKQVAGSSSAELMANFCDNLLKKVQASVAQALPSCTTVHYASEVVWQCAALLCMHFQASFHHACA